MLTVTLYSQNTQPLPPADAMPDTLSVGPESESEEESVSETAVSLTLAEQLKANPNLFYVCIPDTIYQVPAYDTYLFWDTLDVHPYISDLTRMRDTFMIPLSCPYDSYHHPIHSKVNSDFGWRKWKYHYGIDLDLNVGDSIFCSFDGQVRIVKRSKSYGNVIVVRHNNGLETLYAHLSKCKVKVNQEVKGGELLGLGGNTGRSTGPHLHFEIRYLGGAINPNHIIDFSEGKLKADTLTVCSELYSYLHDVRQVRYHTVRSGDTLGKIARKYGTSVSYLCKLNHITPKTILRIGRRIRYT
jgi:murein DD-endopeptidase MepM/ murein hydrolase activator NlpD